MYLHVALPVPRLEPLTYRIDSSAMVDVGYRVIVPLGKRLVTGTVVKVNADPRDDAREVSEVLDSRPTFSADMLLLTKRIADYYLCSWGEVLQAALPSGLQPTAAIRVHIERPLTSSEFEAMQRRAPKRAELLKLLDSARADVTVAYLQKQLRSSNVNDQLEALMRDGWITLRTDQMRQMKARMMRCVTISDHLASDPNELRAVLDKLDVKAPKQSLALAFVFLHNPNGPISVAALSEQTGIGVTSIDALVTKGYLQQVLVEHRYHAHQRFLSVKNEREIELTSEQQQTVNAITSDIALRSCRVHLLQGVTGSGKTIVYQRLIDEAIQRSLKALVLVPEIALTPQLGDRFAALYGDNVAVIHSRVSMGERIQIWNRIARGEVHVVIGARSAVLVDIPNLGLIIVDEEHEPSYKQDEPSPRYNGRDVAIMRGHIAACPVVLGSATPSLETYHHAQADRYVTHRLSVRADQATFPEVRLVDMRRARKLRQINGAFATETLTEIADRLQRNEGAIVFLNKRGFASHVQCDDCGSVPMCSNCDVALTYHKYPDVLRCHYCGFSTPFLQACVTCGSVELHEVGSGTQRLEEELKEYLQKFLDRTPTIARMDADTTSRKGAHRQLLQQFSDGQLDILVGTQMIAKGLDIQRCSLVVVVNADQSLYHTDFRSSERTLQLMLQVSGRAGRHASYPGLVVMQTSNPEHPTMQMCVRGEQDQTGLAQWYAHEHDVRRDTHYPPFSRFVVIEVRSLHEQLAEHHAEVVWALLPHDEASMHVYRPVAPTIPRVRNWYRRIIIIKDDKSSDASGQLCRSYLRTMQREYYAKHASADVRVSIDIDARGSW